MWDDSWGEETFLPLDIISILLAEKEKNFSYLALLTTRGLSQPIAKHYLNQLSEVVLLSICRTCAKLSCAPLAGSW